MPSSAIPTTQPCRSCAAWSPPVSWDGRPARGSSTTDAEPPSQLGRELARATGEEPTASTITRIAGAAASSARAAGAGAVTSGRWLAEVMTDLATHVPVRDRATLEEQLGATGDELADRVVRNASRASAAVGAAAGAVVGVEELAPPSWVLIPFELVVETLLVAAIEVKLLAELHELADRPVTGSLSERGAALVRAWAEQRGVRPSDLLEGKRLDIVGQGARRQLIRSVQRRMLRRLGRSLGAAVPLMAGAAVGAHLNRRATLDFARRVRRDIGAL